MHYCFTVGNNWEMMGEVTSEILIDTQEVLYESVCKETFLWSQTDWIPAYRKNKDIFEKNIVFVAELYFFLNLQHFPLFPAVLRAWRCPVDDITSSDPKRGER